MSQQELVCAVTELQELKRLKEDLDAEIEAAQDRIKAVMGNREELTAGAFRITWKPVTSARINADALRKESPDLYARYAVTTTTRRFLVK